MADDRTRTNANRNRPEIKVVQANLGRGKIAHDLLRQEVAESGAAIAVVSEPSPRKKPQGMQVFRDKAGTVELWLRPDLGVDALTTELEGVVAVRLTRGPTLVGVYLSPNTNMSEYEERLDDLDRLLRRETGREVVVAGDFNAKSPAWGEPRADRRGERLMELVSQHELVIMNEGDEYTFVRGDTGSRIDLTMASPSISRRIVGW